MLYLIESISMENNITYSNKNLVLLELIRNTKVVM